jgi:hypothetical protein
LRLSFLRSCKVKKNTAKNKKNKYSNWFRSCLHFFFEIFILYQGKTKNI